VLQLSSVIPVGSVSPPGILVGGWTLAVVFELGECLSSFAQPLEVLSTSALRGGILLVSDDGVIIGIMLRNLPT
jgi:hypothetical protein